MGTVRIGGGGGLRKVAGSDQAGAVGGNFGKLGVICNV